MPNDGNTDRAAKYLNRSVIQFRNFFYKPTPQKKFIFQEMIQKKTYFWHLIVLCLMTETLTELQNTSIEALSNSETFFISPSPPKKNYIPRDNPKNP